MKVKTILILIALLIVFVMISPAQAQEETGLIRGWIFDDLDKDGERDPLEPGLAGTVVCLVGYDWCDHTEWGEFEFDMLAPGKYRVKLIEYPDGYHQTTRRLFKIDLQAGEIRSDVNFGLTEAPGKGRP